MYHNKSKNDSMKKVLVLLFALALALVVSVFSGTGLAAERGIPDQMKEKLQTQLTHLELVDNYVTYLEQEIENDNPLAQEALDKFLELNHGQQKAFLKAMANTDKIVELLQNSNNDHEVFIIDDIEVPIKMTIENQTDDLTILSTSARTVTASESMSISSIVVTTIYTQVSFNHNGKSATSTITSDHWHNNINPGAVWSREDGSTYLSNGRAFHRGGWTVYASGALGALSESVRFWVSGNATERWKALYFSNSSRGGYDWEEY